MNSRALYHYAMVEYKNGDIKCMSLYRASFADCINLVSIAVNGENQQIKNAWIETSETELMDA